MSMGIPYSGKDMILEASILASEKDLTLIGKNVTITSKDNEYTNKEEHEYKRSGLSVSLGGSVDHSAPVNDEDKDE